MLSSRVRPYAWMGVVVSLALCAYSVVSIAAIASLSGAPNYVGNAARAAVFWNRVLVASGVALATFAIVIVRTRRGRD